MRIHGLKLKPVSWKKSANLMLTSLLLAVALLTAANNIQADTFKNECDKAFGSCPAVVSSITSVLSLDVSNVVTAGISGTGLNAFQTMSGEVNFLNTKWTFLLHSGRSGVDQFIAFKPTKIVTLAGMIQTSNSLANMAIGLFDAMVPSQQAVVFTANGIDMNPFVHGAAVPAPVKTFFDPLYQADHSYKNGDFVIKLAPGLNKLDVVDLGNSGVLATVLDGVGFSGSQLLIHYHLGENILGSLLAGTKPGKIPDVNVTATLPKFTPKILGQLEIPISSPDLKFKLEGGFKKAETYKVSLGVSVGMPIKLGGENVSMKLASVLSQSVTGAEASVSATMANNAVWKPAFGISWLGIQNYTIKFSIIAGATTGVKIGFGGYTMFGDKNVYLASSVTSSSATSGIPIPSELSFAILPTNPNEVGSIALVDMVKLYNEIAKETGKISAGAPQIDVAIIPDIALAGKEKNTGPSISIKLGNEPSFELKDANLRVMGQDIANVTIASLDANGIKINGSTNDDLYAGPFHVPSLEVDISVRVDELPPKITFKTNTTILPGTESTLELALLAGVGRFSTVQDFGDAFKFNFAATAGSENLFSFNKNALKDANISLDASLSSDPGAWIRNEGKAAVNEAFAGLRNGVAEAQTKVRNAQAVVNNLSGEIRIMRTTVLNERRPINARITSAQNHVNSLSGDINTKNSEISRAKAKLHSCTQTVRVCKETKPVWDKPPWKWKCIRYENEPDVWKRTFCQLQNTPVYGEIGGLETAKAGLVIAKASAQETLRLLKEGYNKIPVDLDPRVAALITAKATATLALNVAQAALGKFGEFTRLLTNATDILDHADIFVIKDSSLRGSLKGSLAGEPVVLDMNFSVKGNDFSQRLGFSLTDMSYNAEQFEVVALGIVTNVFLEAAKSLGIIPPELLEDVASLYRERLTTLEAEVSAVVTRNGTLPRPYTGPIIAVTPLTGSINAGFATAMQSVLAEREEELIAARIKANQLKKCLRARSQNPRLSSKYWGAFKVQSQIDDMVAEMEKRVMMIPILAAQCDKLIAEEQANTSYITGGIDPLPPEVTTSYIAQAEKLSLVNGWATYGSEYGFPAFKIDSNGTVIVSGLITGGNYGELATLPAGVRPTKQLIFNMNNHGQSARVDVFPNGKIKWVAGGKEHGWISLSGINFDLATGNALKLSSGWQKYSAAAYGIPTQIKSGTIVRLEGLIKNGAIKPSTIATLPPGSRPNKILVFNVNNNAKSTRIDILPNGQIKWVAGGKDHGWVSLSGINFNLAKGKVLPLTNGWKKYLNAQYAAPSYSKSGDIVTLEGLIEHGAIQPGMIATLPVGFRPSTHLLFSANNHAKSARIDIFPNGQIKWTAGGKDHGWVSLSGINFSIN